MKKTIKIVIITCAFVMLGVGVGFAYNLWIEPITWLEPTEGALFEAGQIQREHENSGERGEVYIEGHGFAIYSGDIEMIEAQSNSIGDENGRERAVRTLLREAVLYAEASSRGFYATEAEVRNKIDTNIELAKKAKSQGNADSVLVFFEGLGMTLEEYFESQYEVFRREITIEKYLETVRKDFFVENGYVDYTHEIQDYFDTGEVFYNEDEIEALEEIMSVSRVAEIAWSEHLEVLIDEIIEDRNVRRGGRRYRPRFSR
ncbi:MAG: hypothetical protein FWF76_02045 [Oscillospiraceae bacterium]|nr:hypothetical protein [Oscillospiraceae bacterium]